MYALITTTSLPIHWLASVLHGYNGGKFPGLPDSYNNPVYRPCTGAGPGQPSNG